jgi:hypothetical protein
MTRDGGEVKCIYHANHSMFSQVPSCHMTSIGASSLPPRVTLGPLCGLELGEVQLQLSRQLRFATRQTRDTLSTIHHASAQYTANMPPKKAKATAKAKAVSKTPTRSTSTAAPATVVTNHGKEYDTIAAAARPRRATAQTTVAPVKAPVKSELNCHDAALPM